LLKLFLRVRQMKFLITEKEIEKLKIGKSDYTR